MRRKSDDRMWLQALLLTAILLLPTVRSCQHHQRDRESSSETAYRGLKREEAPQGEVARRLDDASLRLSEEQIKQRRLRIEKSKNNFGWLKTKQPLTNKNAAISVPPKEDRSKKKQIDKSAAPSCGNTQDRPLEAIGKDQKLLEQAKTRRATTTRNRNYVVQTYFHILESEHLYATINDIDPTVRDIDGIMNALNNGFATSNFQFEFLGGDVYATDYFYFLDPLEAELNETAPLVDILALDKPDVLNVFMSNTYLGQEGFAPPYKFRESSVVYIGHWFYSLDFGFTYQETGYWGEFPAQGSILVHEAGHWLGLWHTFQDGCTEPNDEVADTPAHAGPTRDNANPIALDACFRPEGVFGGLDTCTSPGLDPVDNYMNYVTIHCRYSYGEFSQGQKEFMLPRFEGRYYSPDPDPTLTTGWAWRVRTSSNVSLDDSLLTGWVVNQVAFYSDPDCTVPVTGGTPIGVDFWWDWFFGIQFPETFGVAGNAFDQDMDSAFLWVALGTDMWVGMEFASDVQVRCVTVDQNDPLDFASEIWVDVRPSGEFYWNPVFSATDTTSGRVVISNRQAPPTAPVAPPSTDSSPTNSPVAHSSDMPTLSPIRVAITSGPTSSPQRQPGTPSLSPIAPTSPTGICLADAASCQHSLDCCSAHCAGQKGNNKICQTCSPNRHDCRSASQCCDSKHICTKKQGTKTPKLCQKCAKKNYSCASSSECCGKSICTGTTKKNLVCKKCGNKKDICRKDNECCGIARCVKKACR